MTSNVDTPTTILVEAKRLFAAQGYHALSMREIAAAVGLSKAAIYHHFRDKEDLFYAILMDQLGALESTITRSVAGGAGHREQIDAIIHAMVALPADQRAFFHLASREVAHLSPEKREAFHAEYKRRFIGRIHAVFEDGVKQGAFKPLDSKTLTWTLLGMAQPFVFHIEDAPPEVIDQMLSVFFQGACP